MARRLALEVGQHRFRGLAAIEDLFEEADGAGAFGDRRRAAERKAHPRRAEIVGRLGELDQQAFAGLRRQAIGDAHQCGTLSPRSFEHTLDRDGRTQEDRPPAGRLSQAQEVHDAGNVDALAQSRGNDSFRIAHYGLLLATQAGDLTCATTESLRQ